MKSTMKSKYLCLAPGCRHHEKQIRVIFFFIVCSSVGSASSQRKILHDDCTSAAHSIPKHRKKTSRRRKQCLDTKRKRNRFACVIEGCDGYVQYLPRHHKQVHPDIPWFEFQKLKKIDVNSCISISIISMFSKADL